MARLVPWPESILSRLYSYFIDPPVVGTRYISRISGLTVPTRGQALFIGCIWIFKIVLSAVQYNPVSPGPWYSLVKGAVLDYVGNRFGVLRFANLPLVVLYAGRNNVLLWLTNWSHSTSLFRAATTSVVVNQIIVPYHTDIVPVVDALSSLYGNHRVWVLSVLAILSLVTFLLKIL